MKNLFLLYACAEKFRAAKIGVINVSLSPKASMAEFHATKREDAMKFLKFLDARSFGLRAAELLNLTPAPSRNGFKILKFTPEPLRNRFEILKFTPELRKFKPASSVRLNFALNSVSHASASKFEDGVKFKGAAKFERSAR